MGQNVTTTSQALRVMGVWVRRADAVLADGAAANAARAVHDERTRLARQERELAALDFSSAGLRPDAAPCP